MAAVISSSAHAAVGQWTSTYNLSGDVSAGAQGWAVNQPPLALPFPGPYYDAYAGDGAPGRGFDLRPVGGRLYGHVDDSAPGGGPVARLILRRPGTSTILSARFGGVDFLNDNDGQVLRLALYGGTGVARDFGPPTYRTGNPLTAPVQIDDPSGATSVQMWLFSVCGETTPGSGVFSVCNTLAANPASHAHVGSVTLTLRDVEAPTVAASGALTSGAWTRATGAASATITAHDPGSGIRTITVTAHSPGRADRIVSVEQALCDPAHRTPQPAGRDGAVCPADFTAHVADSLGALPDGVTNYTATATDYSGRTHTTSWPVRIDRTAPTALTATGLPTSWVHGRTPVLAIASATDVLSGVKQIGATVLGRSVGGATITPAKTSVSNPVPLDLRGVQEGRHSLVFTAVDQAGNRSSATVGEVQVDRTPPTITQVTTERSGDRTSISDVQAHDTRSGLSTVQARLAGGGTWQSFPADGALHFTHPGTLNLQVRALDKAGNISAVWSLAVAPNHTKSRSPAQAGPVATCTDHKRHRTCKWTVPKPFRGGYNTIRNAPHGYLIGTSFGKDIVVMRFPAPHTDYPPARFVSPGDGANYNGCGYTKVQWHDHEKQPTDPHPGSSMRGCDTLRGRSGKLRVPPYTFAWMFQRDWVNPTTRKDVKHALKMGHCHKPKIGHLPCDGSISSHANRLYNAIPKYLKALRTSATITTKRPTFVYRNAFPAGFARPRAATRDARLDTQPDFSAAAHPIDDAGGHHPENVGYKNGMIPAGTKVIWRYITNRNPRDGRQFAVIQVNSDLSADHPHIFGRGLSWFFVPVQTFAEVGKPADPMSQICQQPRASVPFKPRPTTTVTKYGFGRDLPNRLCQPVHPPTIEQLRDTYSPLHR